MNANLPPQPPSGQNDTPEGWLQFANLQGEYERRQALQQDLASNAHDQAALRQIAETTSEEVLQRHGGDILGEEASTPGSFAPSVVRVLENAGVTPGGPHESHLTVEEIRSLGASAIYFSGEKGIVLKKQYFITEHLNQADQRREKFDGIPVLGRMAVEKYVKHHGQLRAMLREQEREPGNKVDVYYRHMVMHPNGIRRFRDKKPDTLATAINRRDMFARQAEALQLVLAPVGRLRMPLRRGRYPDSMLIAVRGGTDLNVGAEHATTEDFLAIYNRTGSDPLVSFGNHGRKSNPKVEVPVAMVIAPETPQSLWRQQQANGEIASGQNELRNITAAYQVECIEVRGRAWQPSIREDYMRRRDQAIMGGHTGNLLSTMSTRGTALSKKLTNNPRDPNALHRDHAAPEGFAVRAMSYVAEMEQQVKDAVEDPPLGLHADELAMAVIGGIEEHIDDLGQRMTKKINPYTLQESDMANLAAMIPSSFTPDRRNIVVAAINCKFMRLAKKLGGMGDFAADITIIRADKSNLLFPEFEGAMAVVADAAFVTHEVRKQEHRQYPSKLGMTVGHPPLLQTNTTSPRQEAMKLCIDQVTARQILREEQRPTPNKRRMRAIAGSVNDNAARQYLRQAYKT